MNFSIFRIVGNSLPPRHSPQNNIDSVRFIIENEPHFQNSQRIWVLNKISNTDEKRALTALLDENNEKFVDLAFDDHAHFDAFLDPTGLPASSKDAVVHDDYQEDPFRQEWIIRHKSQLLVGINHARNHALALGRQISTWTLVLDGGVMISPAHWSDFVKSVGETPAARFAIIPMRRFHTWNDTRDFLSPMSNGTEAIRVESEIPEEPQIAFHCESEEIFDERLRYGHRNKAELLVRIGLPGRWNDWTPAPWENFVPLPAPNKGKFIHCGFVIRLPTEGTGKETDGDRFAGRFRGVAQRALEIDLKFALSRRQPQNEFVVSLQPNKEIGAPENLEKFAAGLLAERDRLITDKAIPAPSGSFQDYYTLAPNWTADGVRIDGIVKDFENADDPASGRFDRDSIRMFANGAYGLALSGHVLGRPEMLVKSRDLIHQWLLEKSTRMSPSARYAQSRPGTTSINDVGIVEFRGLALLPYALRLLSDHGMFSSDELADVRKWFARFLRDCEENGILIGGLRRGNNIGTWASVLFCATALYVGEFGNAFYLARTASIRLGKQLDPSSIQPQENKRFMPLHYSLFNLTAWTAQVQLACEFSIRLDNFRGANGESLAAAISFCAENRDSFSDYGTDRAKYDWWIETLTKVISGSRTGEIVIVKDPDFGFPPILML